MTGDLWDALEAASGEPVRTMMDSWILQGGHPLVSLRGDVLSQQPFEYTPAASGTTSAIGDHWQVPLFVRRLGGTGHETRLLLGTEPVSLALVEVQHAADDDSHLGTPVLNAGGWGVYRTAYDPEHLQGLAHHLGELTPLERSILFADTWAAVLADQVGLGDFLGLAGELGHDDEPSTYAVVAGALGLCDRIVTARGSIPSRRRDAGAARAAARPSSVGFPTRRR